MTDADMQMARCANIAKGLANARKSGVCSHERLEGELHPRAKLINNYIPKYRCPDCGKGGTWESLDEDRREVLIEWT
jgi:hypothetical protein